MIKRSHIGSSAYCCTVGLKIRYFSVSPLWVNVDYVLSKGKNLIYFSKYISLRATGVKFADIQSTVRVVRMKHYDRYRQHMLSSCPLC
jgi:hypothetical protein